MRDLTKLPKDDINYLLHTMDAQEWAKAFMEIWGERRDGLDHDLMVAWLANAIMTGYDEANRRHSTEQSNREQTRKCEECGKPVEVADEHFDGYKWCCDAFNATVQPDQLFVVVVSQRDVYGYFNSYGAAREWAEVNLDHKAKYATQPLIIVKPTIQAKGEQCEHNHSEWVSVERCADCGVVYDNG